LLKEKEKEEKEGTSRKVVEVACSPFCPQLALKSLT